MPDYYCPVWTDSEPTERSSPWDRHFPPTPISISSNRQEAAYLVHYEFAQEQILGRRRDDWGLESLRSEEEWGNTNHGGIPWGEDYMDQERIDGYWTPRREAEYWGGEDSP